MAVADGKKDKSWKLESLYIQYKTYGPFKDKYVGKIKFENEAEESFLFNLDDKKTDEILNLIGYQLVTTADELGKKLLTSIGVDRILNNTNP